LYYCTFRSAVTIISDESIQLRSTPNPLFKIYTYFISHNPIKIHKSESTKYRENIHEIFPLAIGIYFILLFLDMIMRSYQTDQPITGETTGQVEHSVSSRMPRESTSLLGNSQNASGRCFRPSVRAKFAIAVFIVLVNTMFMLMVFDSEWFENFRELGVYGVIAQARAKSDFRAAAMSLSDVLFDEELLASSRRHHKHEDQISVPEGCESTVMLVRHCEKYNLRSHCNYVGYERSMYLATQFGYESSDRWPPPSKIYSLQVKRRHGKHKNFREVETAQAIANKFLLPIDEDYHTRDTKHLARDILRSILKGEKCGKLVLITWKHSDLPYLARKLG
jgi:hypothetical protein